MIFLFPFGGICIRSLEGIYVLLDLLEHVCTNLSAISCFPTWPMLYCTCFNGNSSRHNLAWHQLMPFYPMNTHTQQPGNSQTNYWIIRNIFSTQALHKNGTITIQVKKYDCPILPNNTDMSCQLVFSVPPEILLLILLEPLMLHVQLETPVAVIESRVCLGLANVTTKRNKCCKTTISSNCMQSLRLNTYVVWSNHAHRQFVCSELPLCL